MSKVNNDLNINKRAKRRRIINTAFTLCIVVLSIITVIPLFLILAFIFKEGAGSINLAFFISLPKPVGELGGGVINALTGTLMLITLTTIFAVPPGVLVGIYLTENRKNKYANFVRLCVEVFQGIPSIVIGIAVYTWIVTPMGGFSAISGSIALAMIMLPVVIRTTEETLKLIPHTLKEASLALGAPYWLTMLKVILPAGLNGIMTGVLISVARVAGEIAPLLFTAFGNPFVNLNIMKPVSSLPQTIFNYAISPYDDWHRLAWGASFVLTMLVFGLNISSKIIAKFLNKNS